MITISLKAIMTIALAAYIVGFVIGLFAGVVIAHRAATCIAVGGTGGQPGEIRILETK